MAVHHLAPLKDSSATCEGAAWLLLGRRWGYVWGRLRLPAAVNPHIPAVFEVLLTPVYGLYKALGPRLAWRLNSTPVFGQWDWGNSVIGNAIVWGQLAVVLSLVSAVAAALSRRRSSLRRRRQGYASLSSGAPTAALMS